MDLSKIPELTENDLVTADYFFRSYAASYLGATDEEFRRMIRVIAHMISMGRALAKLAVNATESPHALWESDLTEEERAAIEFFEKFGGNDERC